MFIHTEESLKELETYFERLSLSAETRKDLKNAINEERTKLKES